MVQSTKLCRPVPRESRLHHTHRYQESSGVVGYLEEQFSLGLRGEPFIGAAYIQHLVEHGGLLDAIDDILGQVWFADRVAPAPSTTAFRTTACYPTPACSAHRVGEQIHSQGLAALLPSSPIQCKHTPNVVTKRSQDAYLQISPSPNMT